MAATVAFRADGQPALIRSPDARPGPSSPFSCEGREEVGKVVLNSRVAKVDMGLGCQIREHESRVETPDFAASRACRQSIVLVGEREKDALVADDDLVRGSHEGTIGATPWSAPVFMKTP